MPMWGLWKQEKDGERSNQQMYLPGIKVLQKLIKFSIHVSKSTHQAFESDFYISRAAEIRLELKLFCIKWHIVITHITIPGVRYGTWIIIPCRFHARDSFKILSFGHLLLELLRTGFGFPYLQTLDPQIEHEFTSIIIWSAPSTRITENRTHSFWTKTQHTRMTINNNIAVNTNDIWLTEALIDLGSYHGHQAQSPFSVPVLLFE